MESKLTLLISQMLRINYYILSCFSQLEHYTGDTISAESLTRIFTLLLPLGGFVGWSETSHSLTTSY